MTVTLTATFGTRREAEMTVERLVQEHGVDRADVMIAAEANENTAGTDEAGADADGDATGAALNGAVMVSVDLADQAMADMVCDAFIEFNSAGIVEN